MPFMPLVFVTAILHVYIGWRIAPLLPGWAAALFVAVLVVSTVVMPFGLLARRIKAQPLSDVMAWAGLLFMGLFSSLFVLTLVREVVLLTAAIAARIAPGAFDVQALLEWTAAAVPILGLAVTVAGFVNARRTAAIVSVDVPIRDLPAGLNGFTIAQISDIHIGPTIKRPYLDAIVKAVNRLDADMVAVTGDLVDGSVPELHHHVAPLAGLSSKHGTYFVTGNHEYYSGAHAWIAELQRLGVRVLLNEHVVLQHGASALVLAGVTDFSAHRFDPAHRSDPHAAMRGAPAHAGARVLLAHQPRSAEAAEKAGFQLQLSGHTHGGQFMPWNLFVRFQQPFTAGLHKLRELWVYTSRGTGYWGPPKRFGAPSEITRLRLVPAI
ncbi:metallophosphoesterase [soil metagenome]